MKPYPLDTTSNQPEQTANVQASADCLQRVVSLPDLFTPSEWHDISLCVGWTVAMSEGKDEPSVERRSTSMRAMAAMRRVFGEGFHARIVQANSP